MKSTTMKFTLTALLAIMLIVPQFGCEKDSDPPKTSKIEGLWIGYYTVDGEPARGQQYYSLIIKPDGTLINDTKADNRQHLALGTWTLNGENFTATAQCMYGFPVNIGVQQTHTFTFKDGKITSGTWKSIAPATGQGSITLSKVE